MYSVCLFVVGFVVVCARILPQHIFAGRCIKNLSSAQTIRLWEEITSLAWYSANGAYMLAYHVSYDFFFHETLTLNSSDTLSEQHDGVRVLLAANMCFYVGMLIVSLWQPRRRDYVEMATHHVITLALMYIAYIVGFYEVSVFVLFINAISDVFLSASKIAYDLDHDMQTPLFACFVAAHLILRVIYYPFKAWRCYYMSIPTFTHPIEHLPGLCTIPLWLLYLFWTPKIFKVCWRRLVHGVRQVDKSVRQKTANKK